MKKKAAMKMKKAAPAKMGHKKSPAKKAIPADAKGLSKMTKSEKGREAVKGMGYTKDAKGVMLMKKAAMKLKKEEGAAMKMKKAAMKLKKDSAMMMKKAAMKMKKVSAMKMKMKSAAKMKKK